MRERPHSVVDMDGVARAMRDSRAGLLVGSIRVAHGDDNTCLSRGVNAWDSAEQLRSDGEDTGLAGRSLHESLQQFGVRELHPLGGMHAPTRLVDEGTFVVNAEDLCFGLQRLKLLSDVTRNSFDAAARIVRAGGFPGGDEKKRPLPGPRFGPGGKRFSRTFPSTG